MENTRRSFLKKGGLAGAAAAVFVRVGAVARPLARFVYPKFYRGLYLLHVGAIGPLAGRASWPAVCAIALRKANANAALGIAGSAAAAAAALKAMSEATGRPWYNPVFRPSLRSLITGEIR